MTGSHFRQSGICVALRVLALIAALASACGQSQEPAGAFVVEGNVRDSSGRTVANATVLLQPAAAVQASAIQTLITHTDATGAYRFSVLREGAYTMRAEMNGYSSSVAVPVSLAEKETKQIDLTLGLPKTSEAQGVPSGKPDKAGTPTPEFFDEPQFTVAGVTQATNSGGHGSDTVLRTTDALAKSTVSLGKEAAASSIPAASPAAESSLREALVRDLNNVDANRQLGKLLIDKGMGAGGIPYLERASALNPGDAELHHLLGDEEEKLDKPLEAVRHYQQAAELDPNEVNLFDWGTELLAHRALEPATLVFAKGNRLFPKSVRMLVALGVTWYARGSYDQAIQFLVNACDLAPDNPAAYLVLGKIQSVEATPSEAVQQRLRRFAQLFPDNALANYYYAVGLGKQSSGSIAGDAERSGRIESLLHKAVQLDPKLGAAYLQLGVLYSQREDLAGAISAYRQAIEVSPKGDDVLEEAHYRLAQAYLRAGDPAKAQKQLQLHRQLSEKRNEDSERDLGRVQEFVIPLRNKNSATPTP